MQENKKDVLLFFVSKIIVGIVGFLLISLYSSRINPADYGDYSLISGYISALTAILIGWIGSSALRYYVDYEEEKILFYSNVFILGIIMFLVMLIIVFITCLFSSSMPIAKYIIPSVLLCFSASFLELSEKLFRACKKTKQYAIILSIQSILSILLFYLFEYIMNLGVLAVFYSVFISKFVFITFTLCYLKVFNKIKTAKMAVLLHYGHISNCRNTF